MVCLVVGNNRVNGAKFGSGVVDIHLFEKDNKIHKCLIVEVGGRNQSFYL